MYPASIFNNVDFPAPEGPITAVSLPAENVPDTDFKIVLNPLSRNTEPSGMKYDIELNSIVTGRRLGKWLNLCGPSRARLSTFFKLFGVKPSLLWTIRRDLTALHNLNIYIKSSLKWMILE